MRSSVSSVRRRKNTIVDAAGISRTVLEHLEGSFEHDKNHPRQDCDPMTPSLLTTTLFIGLMKTCISHRGTLRKVQVDHALEFFADKALMKALTRPHQTIRTKLDSLLCDAIRAIATLELSLKFREMLESGIPLDDSCTSQTPPGFSAAIDSYGISWLELFGIYAKGQQVEWIEMTDRNLLLVLNKASSTKALRHVLQRLELVSENQRFVRLGGKQATSVSRIVVEQVLQGAIKNFLMQLFENRKDRAQILPDYGSPEWAFDPREIQEFEIRKDVAAQQEKSARQCHCRKSVEAEPSDKMEVGPNSTLL